MSTPESASLPPVCSCAGPRIDRDSECEVRGNQSAPAEREPVGKEWARPGHSRKPNE